MLNMPAFCDSCGAVFPSGIVGDNATVTFVGNRAGPCPRCGDMGHIPDGVFNFVGRTIEILSAPHRTVDELSRLAQIIREARQMQQPPDVVALRIREEIPSLAALADLLPRNRAELYGFLAVIIAALTLVTQIAQSPSKSTSVTVNQTVNQVYVESAKPSATGLRVEQPSKKPGRNKPCPCGSGRKYKKCCGVTP